jgi:hypothetical protein
MWRGGGVVLCFALLLAVVVLFTLLLIRDGMDRDGWGCGAVREELYRARCLVLPVCVCLWNNTAAYKEGSFGKEKQQQRRSPSSPLPDVMAKVGTALLLTRRATADMTVEICHEQISYTAIQFAQRVLES